MKELKIVATSDTHGYLEPITEYLSQNKNIDICIFAGDIAPAEFGIVASDYIVNTFFTMVKKFSEVDFIYVPGNHDFFAQQWDKLSTQSPSNLTFLFDESKVIRGCKFYGTPWVPRINGGWAFECIDEDEELDVFRTIPNDADFLITHTPPRIKHQKIDVSMQFKNGSRPFGSKALMMAIEHRKPKNLICGHIHSGDHNRIDIRHKDGSITSCYNVSCVDERYEPTYSPTLIKFTPNL